MPRQASRTARIEARIAPDALLIVKRAAELQGRSISDFLVAAAQEIARRTIDDGASGRSPSSPRRTLPPAS